ncbi:MAG TPA: NAD-binding protein [Rhizomicrobium sp.]|nr:NAD-binding protein [Rhizomicrobium sp.]
MLSNVFKIKDWIYIVPLAAFGLVLGVYGFMACPDCAVPVPGHPPAPIGLVQAVIRTLALVKATGNFPLDRNHWALFLAQIMMPALAFISVFKVVLQNIRRDARILLVQRMKDHVIVCGLGDTGRQIVESFRESGLNVVAITLDGSSAYAAAAERRNVAVLEGDANQHGLLRLARIRHARSLILVTGSDGGNLEIGMRAREILARSPEHKITILSEMRSEWLHDLIRSQGAATLGTANADFRLFNLNNNAARSLLRSNAFLRALPESAPKPHLMFLGLGRMGTEILTRAMRSNFAVPGQRLSTAIFDRRGAIAAIPLQNANPGIASLADIFCQTCEFGIDDTAWHDTVDAALRSALPLAVIVALDADDITLSVATRVRAILDSEGRYSIPVFLRLRQQHRLGDFIAQLEAQPLLHDRLRPFGTLSLLATPTALLDETIDTLAKASHEIWLAHNSQSDSPAAVPWDRLPEFHKQANRALADYIPVRLRCCGYRLRPGRAALPAFDEATIEKLAALEHWRWCTDLGALGWRHNDVRDDFLKQHNRLLPWPELPETTKAYNRDMARLLPKIADLAAMSIQRDLIVFAGSPVPADSSVDGCQLVIVADPAEPENWRQGLDAARSHSAKLWIIDRGSARQVLQRLPADTDVEMLLSEAEYAALRPAG